MSNVLLDEFGVGASLTAITGARVPLEGVRVSGRLTDLLSEVTVTQSYRNDEPQNIEAVYTFPLPTEAVILSLTVRIGQRELRGRVFPKAAAEEAYEQAVEDGDTAVMLEQVTPGLYTMNVGNVMPGETVEVAVTYCELHRWSGDSLRLRIPTTVAPRYAGEMPPHLPHQHPEHSVSVRNRFSVDIRIGGLPAQGTVTCPTHAAAIESGPDGLRVTLEEGAAVMDRDFVISVTSPSAGRPFALCERDGDGSVVLLGFRPHFAGAPDAAPRSIKIVVDCSGSMEGASISQAREAVLRALDSLRPQDWFNIVVFGSTARGLFGRQHPADAPSVAIARAFANELGADMGGTELGGALELAYSLAGPEGIHPDLFLITDGEVWGSEGMVARAGQSAHRHFTVGVGAAVVEELVRPLAERTGGACEMVTPSEGMAERVHRHFLRIYSPRGKAETDWPVKPESESCAGGSGAVFAGDTVLTLARFMSQRPGTVRARVKLDDGREFAQEVEVEPYGRSDDAAASAGTLARLLAAQTMRSLDDAVKATELAVRYQIMSPHTNYLVVDVRSEGEKAEASPTLRKVPQTLAAGWHGVGTLGAQCVALDCSVVAHSRCVGQVLHQALPRHRLVGRPSTPGSEITDGPELRFMAALVAGGSDDAGAASPVVPTTLRELESLGVPEATLEALRKLVEGGTDEAVVVVAFVSLVLSRHRRVYRVVPRLAGVRAAARALKCPRGARDEVKRIVEEWLGQVAEVRP